MAERPMAANAASGDGLLESLLALTGPRGLMTGEEVRARSCDPLRQTPTLARAIVRPADTSELAAVVALCARRGQPMVVHGGRTGVAGGARTGERDIAISLERMGRIEDICVASQTAVVQAGVTVEALQAAAHDKGLFYPIDLGSKGSATIGGTIATNAGGNRVIRWGMTRQNVLGLEAVLADGVVVSSMNRLVKNNTGYDLKQLFVGSEGTLGIVTRAVLKLAPLPSSHSVAFVSVAGYDKLIELLARARRLPVLSAFEVMWRDLYDMMAASGSERRPLETGQPYYALIEALGYNDKFDEEAFDAFLKDALEHELVVDVVVAASDRQREELWRVREGTEVIVREMSPFLAFDVSIEIPLVEAYLARVRAALHERFPNVRLVTFGHLGDNNIHVGVTVGANTASLESDIESIVYGALPAFGGALTAEHGIGQSKRAYLEQHKSEGEMDLMRRLRNALDPGRLINPDVMF